MTDHLALDPSPLAGGLQDGTQRDEQVIDRGREGGNAADLDLVARNVRLAVELGVLDGVGQYALGLTIGRLLCSGGKR